MNKLWSERHQLALELLLYWLENDIKSSYCSICKDVKNDCNRCSWGIMYPDYLELYKTRPKGLRTEPCQLWCDNTFENAGFISSYRAGLHPKYKQIRISMIKRWLKLWIEHNKEDDGNE